MEGVRSEEALKGVIPRSFDHIFTHISRTKDEQYLIRASYLEIYQEEIRDLLSKVRSFTFHLWLINIELINIFDGLNWVDLLEK